MTRRKSQNQSGPKAKGAPTSERARKPTSRSPEVPVPVVVVFEATEEQRLNAIESSAQELLAKVLNPQDPGDIPGEVWNIREAVWPALGLREFRESRVRSVKLTLLPLSRIGQMEGKSGSLVLIGYFSAEELGSLHSHPLVIKTLDRTKSDKLGVEYSNALSIKPFAYDQKDSFAIPIFFDQRQEGYKILWSICSPSGPIWRGDAGPGTPTPRFEVDDLRKPLVQGDNERAGATLAATFDLLRNCHTRFNTASVEERAVGQEYDWYLRELGEIWGREWQEVWGSEDVQIIGGSRAVNPLWLVNRLKHMRYGMFLGAIHGDLHPGNIVLTPSGQPAIIDFGWAQDKAHVAKDFVLLESNLRFLTLRPQVNPEEAERFADWVAWDSPPPAGLNDYLQGRIGLIERLRQKAAEVFPKGTDWDREYVVPLFLVALGLLRFAPQLGNQQVAVRFVLSSAEYLARVIGGGTSRGGPRRSGE
jgi:hypothetical protein